MEKKDHISLLPKIVNGGIAGVVGLICVFPLDLVKTRLQKQVVGPDGKKMYKNMAHAFIKTYKAEGFFGMYSGLLLTLCFATPEKAIKLTANDFFRHLFKKQDGGLPLYRQVAAGAMAGVCQTVVTTPMELLKIQMQDAGRVAAQAKIAGKKVKTVSSTGLVLRIIKEHGFFGLYKGIGPTVSRDIAFSMIYFPLFATLNAKGPKRNDGSGDAVFWWSIVAGCVAGGIGAFAVTPVDVVKTRIQTISKAEGDRTYTGLGKTFMDIVKHEGPLALFKGGACRVIVVAPLFGITQAVYYLGVAEYLLGYKK